MVTTSLPPEFVPRKMARLRDGTGTRRMVFNHTASSPDPSSEVRFEQYSFLSLRNRFRSKWIRTEARSLEILIVPSFM